MIEKLVVLIEIAGCTSTKYSLTFSRYLQLSQNIINHFQRKSKLNKNNKMKILLFADDNFMKTIKALKVKTVITERRMNVICSHWAGLSPCQTSIVKVHLSF